VPDQRGQLLRAVVGFAGLPRPSYDRALWALRTAAGQSWLSFVAQLKLRRITMLRKALLIAAAALEYIVMEVALPAIVIVTGLIMFGLLLDGLHKYPDLFGLLGLLLIRIVRAFLERG
jgi:hypothetical protein